MTSYTQVMSRVRGAFNSGKTRPVEYRRQQLQQMLKMVRENKQAILDALHKDLNKPNLEGALFGIDGIEKETQMLIDNVEEWAKDEEVTSMNAGDKSFIRQEPYGVVLVMGAWNYPFLISLIPTAGAIAAGNTVVLKPSEVAPASADLMAQLFAQYVDKDVVQVVCGGVTETTELLRERFDYIFYTGSTTVGRIVRQAANQFLTPTTLELGGKSPCYVDSSADLDLAVQRILWGKCANLGQTCIAPDHVMCAPDLRDQLVTRMRQQLLQWYGNDPKSSPDLGRIVAERHIDRLAKYLKDGKVVIGGNYDRAERWMEPTVMVDVAEDSPIMADEIFGPILPVLTVDSSQHAIDKINKGEKPLALYVFSQRQEEVDKFLQQVSAGGVAINDVILHSAGPYLPFGGVGYSGMGAYHGKLTFTTFSHAKPVLVRPYDKNDPMKMRFPPYSKESLQEILN